MESRNRPGCLSALCSSVAAAAAAGAAAAAAAAAVPCSFPACIPVKIRNLFKGGSILSRCGGLSRDLFLWAVESMGLPEADGELIFEYMKVNQILKGDTSTKGAYTDMRVYTNIHGRFPFVLMQNFMTTLRPSAQLSLVSRYLFIYSFKR